MLSADFDLPFVILARTVIESAVQTERQHLAAIRRLYDVYWQSLRARGTLDTRISALEGSIGWALEVRDLDGDQTLAQGRQAARWRAAHPEGPREESARVSIPGVGNIALLAHPAVARCRIPPCCTTSAG